MITIAEEILPTGLDRTEEWHAARRTGIGASEIAACVDAHPYVSAVQVWMDKMGIDRPREVTDAMLAGIHDEAAVAYVFSRRTGHDLDETGMWRRRDHPIALANPDRLIPTENAGLEIKTHGQHSCRAWADLTPPWYVIAQAQWSMYVTGLSVWWVASWCRARAELKTFRLEANPGIIDYLRIGADELWAHVEAGTVPPGVGAADLAALYPDPIPGTEVVDDRLIGLRRRLEGLTGERDLLTASARQIEGQMAQVRTEIAEIMGAAEIGRDSAGDVVVRWGASTRRTVDVAALRLQRPDIAAEFAKTTATRPMTFPRAKG